MFTYTGTDTLYLTPNGGKLLTLLGEWNLGDALAIYIGGTGTIADALCQSGIAGQNTKIYPINATTVQCYAPVLPSGLQTADLYIVDADSNFLSPGAFLVRPDQFYSQVYSYRSVLPPAWACGPRSLDNERIP